MLAVGSCWGEKGRHGSQASLPDLPSTVPATSESKGSAAVCSSAECQRERHRRGCARWHDRTLTTIGSGAFGIG